MVSVGQIRKAAGEVADDYTHGEDPDGNQAEQLASDETFGTLAHAYRRLWITRRYGDDVSEAVLELSEAAMRELDEALEARTEEILSGGAECAHPDCDEEARGPLETDSWPEYCSALCGARVEVRGDGEEGDECQCILRREIDDQSVCNDESDDGNLCGKPDGHDGPHAACNVATHPVEMWE